MQNVKAQIVHPTLRVVPKTANLENEPSSTIELRLQIELLANDSTRASIQQPSKIADRELSNEVIEARMTRTDDMSVSGVELEAIFSTLRYCAANENVSEEWVMAGVKKVLQVDALSEIKRKDFAIAVMAIFDVLGI